MAQYLSTCMPWEIVVCVEYKDLNGILQQRQPATKRDIVYQFRFERPIANLHALRAANTNPANFVLRNYWHLWKGFPKIWYPFERLRLSAAKKIVIHLNGTGYPFEKGISSLGTTIHSRKIVIRSRSNGSGCPLEKCHLSSNGSSYPFKTIVIRATVPNHFQPSC